MAGRAGRVPVDVGIGQDLVQLTELVLEISLGLLNTLSAQGSADQQGAKREKQSQMRDPQIRIAGAAPSCPLARRKAIRSGSVGQFGPLRPCRQAVRPAAINAA